MASGVDRTAGLCPPLMIDQARSATGSATAEDRRASPVTPGVIGINRCVEGAHLRGGRSQSARAAHRARRVCA